MISPDSCSSTRCVPPQSHCVKCSHALWMGSLSVDGAKWWFEFNPMFGVDFVDSTGVSLESQPNEDNEVWDAWQQWYGNIFNIDLEVG